MRQKDLFLLIFWGKGLCVDYAMSPCPEGQVISKGISRLDEESHRELRLILLQRLINPVSKIFQHFTGWGTAGRGTWAVLFPKGNRLLSLCFFQQPLLWGGSQAYSFIGCGNSRQIWMSTSSFKRQLEQLFASSNTGLVSHCGTPIAAVVVGCGIQSWW